MSRTLFRTTDPGTSREAASYVRGLTEKQQAVLHLLRRHRRGLSDQSIIALYGSARGRAPFGIIPRQSESGIRTRRAELVARGLVRDTGRRTTTPSGRKAIVWQVVS
jgi:hypothetical protein